MRLEEHVVAPWFSQYINVHGQGVEKILPMLCPMRHTKLG